MTRSFDLRAARARLCWELVIVLALSLGASAVWAVLSFVERVTRAVPLAQQRATLNSSMSERAWLDLLSQLASFVLGLAPVALVVWLVWRQRSPHLATLGLSRMRLGRQIAGGFALAACIGMPGLAFYAVARVLGWNVAVVAADLGAHWWSVPVLVLMALKAALLEELIVVGYLFDRLRRLRVSWLWVILGSALLRGSYHLYQGVGGFIGNVVMGLVFGLVFRKTGRVLPLVVAHLLLDVVSFVGYPLAAALWPAVFAPA